MKLVSYGPPHQEQPGVLTDHDTIVPLRPALSKLGQPMADMATVLRMLPELRSRLESLVQDRESETAAAAVRLGPPVPQPRQIIAVGANYASHLQELDSRNPVPSQPVLFAKSISSLSGPTDDVVRPPETTMMDYECELAVVIGVGGRRIPRHSAMNHVAGFMIANDVTARDVVMRDGHLHSLFLQILRGKSFDTFCPTGPWLVTTDEAPDPAKMRMQLWVNDELRQDDTPGNMIYDIPSLVESVSGAFTVHPGDILLTGSPPGPGFAMKPPQYLQPGDVLRLSIESLGTMITTVRDEVI